MRPLRSILALIACALLAACSPSRPAAADPRPDVVLIVIDTFRPDHLGTNGYHRQTAPFLEGLMERSAVFRRAYSTSSWTAPATSSIFTSLYPTRHGVTEGFLAHGRRAEALEKLIGTELELNRLPADVETLPEVLRNAGYSTFGLASNINIGPEIGFDRGFDEFADMQGRSAKRLAEKLLSWRQRLDESKPCFVYLHFNDVHGPYHPRAPWYEPSDDELADTVSAYDSEISFLDEILAGLYRELEWDRNTLLVVVSDHGEEFDEHGQIGHEFTLYDELMRVLVVISGADLGIPARKIDVAVSLIDIAPTILDLAGIPIPAGREGISLVPWLAAEPPAAEPPVAAAGESSRVLFAHRLRHRVRVGKETQHLWAAVRGPWKRIEEPAGPRLFHLEDDPAEKHDLTDEQPEIAAELAGEIERFRAAGFHRSATTAVELDRETLEALQSLGYVQ